MMTIKRAAWLVAGALVLAAAGPVARVAPVIDHYWGTPVTDNYRWMEAPGSAELAAWMKAQNAITRADLDAIPGRAPLLKAITAASNSVTSTGVPIRAGGFAFYLQTEPGKNTAKLYKRDEATGKTTLIIDPDAFSKAGGATAVNFFQPSQDGRYVAYGVSAGGSEAATLRVIDTSDLRDQGVAIDRVEGDNDEFLPVWWLPDGKSFVYYRLQKLGPHDPASAHFQKSRDYLHHLGANPHGDGDVPVFGYDVTPGLSVGVDQDALVATVPGNDYAFGMLTENESNNLIDALYATPIAALESGHPVWSLIAGKDAKLAGFDAHGDRIYLLSSQNAPRFKLVATSISKPDFAHAQLLVPQGGAVLKYFGAASDGIYVDTELGGVSAIKRYAFDGAGTALSVPLPYRGTVESISTSGVEPGVLYSIAGWVEPSAAYAYAPGGRSVNTGLIPPASARTDDLTALEVKATSYDGTLVPLSIVMKKGTRRDGSNPTLLIGYGSYGITIEPEFVARYEPWLQRGYILAIAHPRGGGWNGEGWHQAGMKLKKLNTVFDFIACAQYLVDQHYTAPRDLAGEGGSAGGITIGGAINWRPDLFAAAIDSHGETDNLRSELTPNGPPNIVEFGSVTTEDGFHGLYAMSPYANIRDNTRYPAVLLQTGVNDPRVSPWEVTKLAARLQAASISGKPILLAVSYDSGHGIGDTKAQRNADLADELSFALWQFGVKQFQPR